MKELNRLRNEIIKCLKYVLPEPVIVLLRKIVKYTRGRLDKQCNRFLETNNTLVRRYVDPGSLAKSVTSEDVEATLVKGCDVLEEIGVKYWLASGTLLGIHRERAFIKHDRDVDVNVYTDNDVYKIIKKVPFNDIVRIVKSNNQYMQLAFLDKSTGVIFDIWFYHDSKERLINTNDYGVFWYPTEKIKNLSKITFRGREYPAPDPEWYCNFVYGENWREPKKHDGHWTKSYISDCKGFVFTDNKNARYINCYE